MRPNTLRRLHRGGRAIVNGWLSISSPYVAELAAHQGYDALTVDMQHGMIGFEGAGAMFQAIAGTAATPRPGPARTTRPRSCGCSTPGPMRKCWRSR